MSKIVYILRGVSGSGKSSLAKELAPSSSHICCADDFFMKGGEYIFNPALHGEAHKACFNKYCELVDMGYGPIVVANTNTTEKEISSYTQMALANGYQVFSIVLENRHGSKDVHNVPDDVLKRQEQNLRNSLRLRNA